jgi:DNA-binding MarR family transcriptional regulator
MGLSELSFIEGLNPTMLSRIAGKLEAAGLIIRAQDPRDGRAAQLSATESGRMVHDRIRTERTDALLVALAQLSSAERVALTAALPALESLTQSLRRAPR